MENLLPEPDKKPDAELILSVKEKIKDRLDDIMTSTDLHILDAAKVAGVSNELVIANIGTDPDFQRWWEMSKTRSKVHGELIPERKPAEIVKKDALNYLVAGGLFEKLGMIAAMADPENELDKDDLFKLGNLATKLMPTQSNSISIKATMEEMQQRKEEEIIAEIKRTEDEMKAMMQERGAAEKARESYVDGDDEPDQGEAAS